MNKKETPFWLVWNEEGYPPRYKHETIQSAENEAARLARENAGKKFYVLTPICMVKRNDIVIERYND